MTEKLRIYSSFRNGSAVDSEVFASLARTVLMNDLGYVFLTDSTFSGYKDSDIGRSDSHSHLERTVQGGIIADYIVSVFKTL